MTAVSTDATGVERLWTVEDVSAFLQVPVATLYQWRHHRCGPPAFKVGKHLRYDRAAVRDWLTRQAA
jgi:predicted DNA-binding transcriptional regulator AlpA